MGLITRGALSGAGDTRFPPIAMAVITIGAFYPAAWLLSGWIDPPLTGAWLGVFVYLVIVGSVMWLRFEQGRWRHIRLAAAEKS